MSSLSRADILERIQKINVWKRREERAPHKPLLVLLAIARTTQGQDRLTPFRDLDNPLRRLLEQFGPPRLRSHPEYPFWRLQNDGLWEVPDSAKLVRRQSNTDPKKSELIAHHVMGGFPEPVFEAFRRDQPLRDDMVRMLLQGHFPESLHEDILNEVGLTLTPVKIKRDPAFREEVLQAYERRCAVCGYDTKVGAWDLALDAAHIQWHQAAGPSVVQNGLALCAIHHKALDRGAIGLAEDGTILVSGTLHGSTGIQEWFLAFKGKRMREPHSRSLVPSPVYFSWHRRQVFRGRARE